MAESEKQISVIVPVYNTKRFLPECIQGLLNQSYSQYEILLIDDGSTDGSGAYLDELEQSRPEKIRVIHQNNAGVSAARNTGLRNAKGDFVVFCDSDDMISPAYLQTLMSGWQEGLLPIAEYTTEYEQLGQEEECPHREVFSWASEESRKYLVDCVQESFLRSANCKLYQRDIIVDQNLCFDETMCVGEDFKFVLQYLRYCPRICRIHKMVYYYRDNPNSITKRMGESKIRSKEKIRTFWHGFLEDLPGEKTELMELAYRIELEDYYNVMLLIYAYNRECIPFHKAWKDDPLMKQDRKVSSQRGLPWKMRMALKWDCRLLWELLAMLKRGKDCIRTVGKTG